MIWILALTTLLAFAAGWVACTLFEAHADDHRRGRIDWSTAAARGELLHLDWSDKRDDRP